jgi:hypothetical protein
MRDVVAANPGPAVHMAVLGVVVVLALVVFGVVRWRHKREEAEARLNSDARSENP